MFDIGFWELGLIAVIALLVVGPERLPGLARTLGVWVGRTRRFVASVKADFEREVRAEELQKALNKQNEFRDVYEIVEDTQKSVNEVATGLNEPHPELETPAAPKSPRGDPDPAASPPPDEQRKQS